jgi:translocator protein
MKNALALIGFIGLSFIPAILGASFLPGEWYFGLNKPSWNPPNYLFGLVWTPLYVMIGVSAWLIWKDYGFKGAQFAFVIFAVQMICNALYSPVLFGGQSLGGAFVLILVMLFFIFWNAKLFYDLKPFAGFVLLPYALWVSFASFLNYTLWQLNR